MKVSKEAPLRDVTNLNVDTGRSPSFKQPHENTPRCQLGQLGYDGACTPGVADATDYNGQYHTDENPQLLIINPIQSESPKQSY